MKRPWLAPLRPLYAAGLALRNLRLEKGWEAVQRLRFPVVSIGNLSTGGAGKTPLTIALAKALTQRGFQVDMLSRGYGRRSKFPTRVDPQGSAEDYGDEPLLIAQATGLPVYVAARRYEAGLLAEAEFPSAGSDLDDSLLPAGNLREPLKAARRASIIAIPADDPELEAELKAWGWRGSVWRLHRKMDVPPNDSPVAAFCGIAHPEQFFRGLQSAGLRLTAQFSFPDHHRYTATDLDRITSAARKAGATALITTEKDLVRLGKLSAVFPESLPLKTASLRIEIEDEPAALELLTSRLK
jgi:tetraacyldisaccharide 4'-kinase